jgi:hypothetical protein
MSIFTGIIGPGTRSGAILLSYLMTDVRPIIYAILFWLILAFAFAAFRKWKFYRFTVFLILIAIISLAIVTLLWYVSVSRDGMQASGFSWGWIFLSIGAILLFWSYNQRKDEEGDGKFSETIDTIIGIMWGFALACIAGIIILSSLSFFTKGRDDSEILTRLYESGSVQVLSGEIKIYGSYPTLPSVEYQRGEGYLLTTYEKNKDKIWEYRSKENILSWVLQEDESPYVIGKEIFTIDMNGHARTASGRVILGSRSTENRDAILYKEDGVFKYHNEDWVQHIAYTGIVSSPIVLSEDSGDLVWAENKGSEKFIVKNGVRTGSGYPSIWNLTVSANWQNISFLTEMWGEKKIIRNDILIWNLSKNVLSGSYVSNGAHSLYVTKENATMDIHLDTSRVSRGLQDVREVFLEKNGGGSYAYFGKPVGEEKWCLFTRYKGNLCWLEWYMNPRLWADGSSIIFAWRKDGIWNIYRNTDSLTRDTGYSPLSVEYDYAFYDLTNPRTYLFITYDINTKKYSYRKNGKEIPGLWDDVSTDVHFGYDNHIITSTKKDGTWKIIEL